MALFSSDIAFLFSALRSGLFRRRDNAQLLHHAQGVVVDPGLLHLAAGDAVELYARHRHLITGWGDAHEITLMCALTGPSGHDPVSFGDLILDGEMGVGVGATVHGHVLLYALRTAHLLGDGGIVEYVVGGEELVRQLQVTSPEDLFEKSADNGLVLLRLHRISSFRGCLSYDHD